MSLKTDLPTLQEQELVIATFDLSGYFRYSLTRSDREIATLTGDYYEFVGDLIADGGGTVIKFMGDAALLVYPVSEADRAVNNLLQLKHDGDAWLAKRKVLCENIIKAHVGKVLCGPFGTRAEKRFDIFGMAVMETFKMTSHGLAISPELFRKLKPNTRRAFKKHTPPITYIPVKERHR